MSETCIALLRGINVGGHNRLAMAQLARIVESIGGRQVRTYIQSGNVVFVGSKAVARRASVDLASALVEQAGVSSPVLLRTVDELEQVVAANPYLSPTQDEGELHVLFLADRPTPTAVAGLDAQRSPPDEFTVVGPEIYLRCPNGMARTKLSNAYFDQRLSTISTGRNWRTTRKLLELAQGAQSSA